MPRTVSSTKYNLLIAVAAVVEIVVIYSGTMNVFTWLNCTEM